jgi:hypothetical protein
MITKDIYHELSGINDPRVCIFLSENHSIVFVRY